jgi:hypothetical protein
MYLVDLGWNSNNFTETPRPIVCAKIKVIPFFDFIYLVIVFVKIYYFYH